MSAAPTAMERARCALAVVLAVAADKHGGGHQGPLTISGADLNDIELGLQMHHGCRLLPRLYSGVTVCGLELLIEPSPRAHQ